MIDFLSGTRILQSRNNVKRGIYELYNNQLEETAEISWLGMQMLRYAYKHNTYRYLPDFFLKQLEDIGLLVEKTADIAPVFCKPCHSKFPLSALNIEIVNVCNFKCNHCYGSFPKIQRPEYISFHWLEKTLCDLNSLHTKSISITGGEPTLHPQFIEIVQFFLKNGFEVCVFTNGSKPDVISKLLKSTQQYHFRIKVSLDGLSDVHNAIRGNKGAFENAIKTLDNIFMNKNVSLCISTTIQRDNIANIKELDAFIADRYPSALHTKDIAFPMGNGCKCAFRFEEIEDVRACVPELFAPPKVNSGNSDAKGLLRCSGGVSQCTLMSNGKLKICNAACDKRFEFRHNAFEVGLKYAWIHCGSNVQAFRKEKRWNTGACKLCNQRDNCHGNDCRVLAFVYTGSEKNNNPLTCFTTTCSNEVVL